MPDVGSDARIRGLTGCAPSAVDAGLVAALRARLPEEHDSMRLAELFRLLGDPKRMRLLMTLLEAGELCVCDLAATVGTSETGVSHALRLLRTAGVVRSRRDGRRVFYSLDDAHVRMLIDLSAEHLRHHGSGAAPAAASTKDGSR